MTEVVVRSERVVLPGGVEPATLQIRNGVIARVAAYDETAAGVPMLDAGALVVLPGLVDTHVHINEPGRTDWEGFATATRAAAAGGVTTVVDMPLNAIPPTTTSAALAMKRSAARHHCHVDVGFWGGVVPGNAGELEPLARAGVRGFKCFLSPSGVGEFAHVDESTLREALPVLARLGLPLLVHAELPALLRPLEAGEDGRANPRRYSTWLESRPVAAEHGAIALVIALAREYDAHVHVVHLANEDVLTDIAYARSNGIRLTVETCPHYLTFAAEDIADGATPFKCAPPIRERRHREGLWFALTRGDVDFIATDHSPSPPDLKHLAEGDFVRAWGGIASLQLSLSIVWSGMIERQLPIELLSRWLAERPARLAGLATKGVIVEGCDADLVVFDPEAAWTVDAATLYHRHPVTPYDGTRLRGRVEKTILRGEVIYADGTLTGPPTGRLL